jgi:hypothetical protein
MNMLPSGEQATAMHSLDKSPPDLVEAKKALTGIVDSAHRAENIINRIRDQIKKAPPTMRDQLFTVIAPSRNGSAVWACEYYNVPLSDSGFSSAPE